MGWTDAYCSEILGGFMHGAYRNHTKQLLWEIEKARMPETMPAVERRIKIRKMVEEEKKLLLQVEEARSVLENLRNMHYTLTRNIRAGNVDGSSIEEMEAKKKTFHRACPVAGCTGFLSSQWKCGVCETWTCKDCMEVIGKDKEAEHVCNPDVLASAQLLKKETKPCPSCSAAIYKISGCDQMWCTQCKVAFSWRTGLKVNGTIHNPHFYEWQRQNGGVRQNPGAIACGGIPTWGNYSYRLENMRFPNWKGNNYLRDCFKYTRTITAYLCHSPDVQYYGDRSNMRQIGYGGTISKEQHQEVTSAGGLKVLVARHPDRYETIPLNAIEVIELYDMDGKLTGNVRYSLKTSKTALDFYRFIEFLKEKHRCAAHFQGVELDRLRREMNNNNDANEEYRIRYIMKELEEERFKTNLIKNNRKMKKKRAILDIYEVFNNVMSDCIRTIYEGLGKANDNTNIMLKEQAERMENVRKYANTELLKISKTYKQVVPFIQRDGSCYNTVKYEGELKKRGDAVGIDKVYDVAFEGSVADKMYNCDIKDFNYYIPKVLRTGYTLPKPDKEIEYAYECYKAASVTRRRRY